MPLHLILLALSFVLLLVAGLLTWPRTPPWPYGHALGWFGLAALVLSMLVP